jgi:hypothetical protein
LNLRKIVLSLATSPSYDFVLSSSADSRLVKHYVYKRVKGEFETQEADTKHSGQASLAIRSDSLLCATAGWDARIRVYSVKTLRELAVLKWHKTGCLAVAFGNPTRGIGKNWIVGGSKDGNISLWEVY